MAGVAHNPTFAKKVGIPQSVGEEFNEADKETGILKQKRMASMIRKPRIPFRA